MSRAPDRGFADVQIPVGGGFWRALGANGALAVGYGLASVHLALLTITTAGAGDQAREGLDRVSLLSTAILPLLATSFIWIGELIRRGRWRGPSGHKPDALLRQGSITATVRMLPASWHLFWLLATAGVSAVLLGGVVRSMNATVSIDDRVYAWTANGILLAAVAGAVGGSLVKKLVWARRAGRSTAPSHPALARRRPASSTGRTFWRWFSYRWRLDLWSCAVGAVALWAAGAFLGLRSGSPGDADSITSAAVGAAVLGILLLGSGLAATTQFWRAGEDLASSESVA